MSLYTLSEFLSIIKENVLGDDIPSPVSDEELLTRFERSALRLFSQVYPKMTTFVLGEEHLIRTSDQDSHRYYEYQIPKYVYQGSVIIDITHIDSARTGGYGDTYVPEYSLADAAQLIAAVADVQMQAAMASNIARNPTKEFIKPDICRVYNGWGYGSYEIELLLSHDLSLSSIPDDAFMDLEELATLDIGEYLYNKLKRKDGIDTGVGASQLKIDEWANARQEKRDLLKSWREEGANLSFQHITRY